MKKPNEIDACNASVRIFNALTGRQYVMPREWTDEQNRQSKDVECILASDTSEAPRIAVEHTIIEPFESEIEYVKESHGIVEAIDVKCAKSKSIPDDRYYFLVLPPQLVKSLKKKTRDCLIERVSDWVGKVALTLEIDRDEETFFEGHRISLMCCGGDPDVNPEMYGHVWRMPTGPKNCERLWLRRIERAIQDKLPKFSKYKRSDFEKALLLEDIGGSLQDAGRQDKARICIQRLVGVEVDYVIVFASRNEQMVVGQVWKEKSGWYSPVPREKIFLLRE